MSQPVFVMQMNAGSEWDAFRVVIDGLRTFGGELSDCPVWLFVPPSLLDLAAESEKWGIKTIARQVPSHLAGYWFGSKVYTCALAEKVAAPATSTLIWIDTTCLVVNPPVLFDLGNDMDAAVRPVHIRNIGLRTSEPVDDFWRYIYGLVGVEEIGAEVESFVDHQVLRAYYNTHTFAVRPGSGLLQQWLSLFETAIQDAVFQEQSCQDDFHQIFLHQAILSALLAVNVLPGRLRILPPTYSYPYHLHDATPMERRIAALNDLVVIATEGDPIDPDAITDVDIREPLRSWLKDRLSLEPGLS